MNRPEQEKWDARWAAEAARTSYEPHRLLVAHAALLEGGRALDLACGLGQNSIWLAARGYQVLAVDFSPVALAVAGDRARVAGVQERIKWQQQDLEEWRLVSAAPAAGFDLVCVFRFLDRRLFPGLRAVVRAGGLLFYETRHVGLLARQPQSNPAFLLQPGELMDTFNDWEIVYEAEDQENASLVARRPSKRV
jgi:tellurite methyltransferase